MTVPVKRTRSDARLARKAIADFVDSNIPRFNGWLNQIADGIPQYDKDGVVQLSPSGCPIYLVKPDPATALKLVADICEYHLPKLSRSEQSAVVRIEQAELDVSTMSTEDLKRFVLRQAGVDSIDALTIDLNAEPVVTKPEPVPDWLEPK